MPPPHTGPYSTIEDVEVNASVYQEKEVPAYLQDQTCRHCLFSLIGPEGCGQKHSEFAMRIYGCRESKSDANRWAAKIPSKSGLFDVIRVDCNEWVALPPRQSGGCGEERGNEERVDDIMARFKAQEVKNKERLQSQLDKTTRVEPARKEKPSDLNERAVLFEDPGETGGDTEGVDNLTVSVEKKVRDKSQVWTVMSVVAPDYPADHKPQVAVRIHGCREHFRDADEWTKQLRDSNPYFSVFIAQNNVWGAFPPRIDKIGNVHSTDEVIQKLHDSYTQEEIARRKDQAKEMTAMHKKGEEEGREETKTDNAAYNM